MIKMITSLSFFPMESGVSGRLFFIAGFREFSGVLVLGHGVY